MGRNLKSLVGKKFERLTVLVLAHRDKHRNIHYLCRCCCGKEKVINGQALRSQLTTSCGCLHREHTSLRRVKDLTGKTFGRLCVVRGYSQLPLKSEHWIWECQCSCGKTCKVTSDRLRSGATQSCGCYHSDLMRMKMQTPEYQRLALMRNQQRALGYL